MPVAPVPVAPFDYSRFPPDVAEEARAVAERVRQKTRSLTVTILELGRDLTHVKSRLGHGAFGAWLEAEFTAGVRTAQNYMRAYEAFGEQCEIISHLPPAAVYALAAPSVPATTRDAVVLRLQSGEQVQADEVKAIVRETRPPRPARAAPETTSVQSTPANAPSPEPILPPADAERRLETARKLAEIVQRRLSPAELETLRQLARGDFDVWGEFGRVLMAQTVKARETPAVKPAQGLLFDLI